MPDEVRYLVLGTAGHIDHGKTALIKALTGIDCDRLAEERERGITIDIGFAHIALPSPTPGGPALQLGIVDVPGHRRFVRNMVAGAAGIDLVLLVVAADDGVMPQTIEHLQIARLLGVQTGLVALTKIDLVDADLLELAMEDVLELLAPTFLAGAPAVPVSSATGQGLDELRTALGEAAARAQPRRLGDRFRMPIDRAFTIKGAGTVVTGTTIAGSVSVEDQLQVMPAGRMVRVRGIQVHGAAVKTVGPGRRTAINLVGVDKDELGRGDVLVQPGSIELTYMFDAEVELLSGDYAPLRQGSEAMLHVGTAELAAKLHALDADQIAPGVTALVQLRLGAPVTIAVGDRFILRHTSGDSTIGGGVVLDAHPRRHRRHRHEIAARLTEMRTASSVEEALIYEVEKSRFGLDRTLAARLLNVSAETISQAVSDARAMGHDLQEHAEGRQVLLTMPANRSRILDSIVGLIKSHHASHPLRRSGLSVKEVADGLRAAGGDLPPALVARCLDEGAVSGTLTMAKGSYALAGHTLSLTDKDRRAVETLIERLDASFTPDQPDDFADELPVNKGRVKLLVEHLLEDGQIIATPGGIYFSSFRVDLARRILWEYFSREQGLTVSQFSQLVDSSRKYSIPLLQYFEQNGMLVRDGDLRRLAPGAKPPE